MTDNTLPRTLARISGVAAMIGPVLLLLSSVAYLTDGNEINDGVLGGTIGVWSCIALALATVGICRLAEPLAPRAAPIVNAVALTGWIGGMSFNITAMYTERHGIDFINDPELDGADLIGVLAYLPWGWMAPLGMILMGWLLWRTKVVASWTAGLLALGGVLFVTGRPERIDVVVIATDVVLTVALVAIGLRLLRSASATGERTGFVPADRADGTSVHP